MKKLTNRLKGFTLIELMIVVAIIGILAAIAIPNFIRYQLRSKTAEARTNIGGIKTNQESFRGTEDNYANITMTEPAAFNGTTKTQWPEFDCQTAGMCDRTATPNCIVFGCIGYKPAGPVYYIYDSPHRPAAPGTTAEFAVGAQADLDGDTMIGSFEYQSNNTVGGSLGIVDAMNGTCNAGIIAGEVTDCNIGQF